MLVLPEIYVLRSESIQKKDFSKDNLNTRLDQKNTSNVNFDKKFLIKIDDLDLPVRALNFLKTENINYVGELVQYTEKDILGFSNSGRKSLQDIKYALSQINLTLGIKLEQESDLDQNVIKVSKNKIKHKLNDDQIKILITEIRNTNLSQRSINGLINIGCFYVADILKVEISDLKKMPNLGVTSIKEIELFIQGMNLEFYDELTPWDEQIIQECNLYFNNKKKNDYLNIKSYQNEKFLEEEILRVLSLTVNASTRKDAVAKNKSLEILINRFGLDGSPPKTLEIIGQKFNVTRERIRQIIKSSLRKLKKINPPTPILNKVFSIVLDLQPLSEIELNKILKEKNITKQDWDFRGLKDFYENFGIKLDCDVTKINNINFISELNIEKIIDEIINYTNKKISTSGIVSILECLSLKVVNLNNIKKESLKKIFQTKPLFYWLDNEENFFSYYSKRNRLSNLISKAAAATDQININYLFERIKNYHRLSDINYSINIFMRFCQICFDCEIKNQNINFFSKKSKLSDYDGYQGKIISENEQKIIEIFKKFGPILNWSVLKELAIKSGVSEPSLNMIMQFSVLFQRIDIATYKLSGQKLELVSEKVKIDLMSKIFNKKDCNFIANDKQYYVEIYKLGKYIKTIAYPQTLLKINDSLKGVEYKNKIYPVIFIK
jgi:hypothetical protein